MIEKINSAEVLKELNIINKINTSDDLQKLNIKQKEELAEEIRKYILEIVSKNGGHLASNLGVVELTIALHSVFNLEKDTVIWDVGHQTYVHKILTGRREELKTLRKLDGIAGFPKVGESKYDSFNSGHSSDSISVALGIARANKIKGKDSRSIALIGDGALTGGMALEALNDAGSSKANITVILNDNEMSISKNVGGVSLFLSKLRTKKLYTRTNKIIKKGLSKIPVLGNVTIKLIRRIKKSVKQIFISKMFFEDIGFTYLGPVDGHDLEKLESILKISKQIEGPVLVHVLTKKGKGYKPAEENPNKFHATGPFNIENGQSLSKKKDDYSKIFGNKVIELAKQNEKIVAVTAAMKDGTGLTEFKEQFPDRLFDVGIAEQHALGMAAGLAKGGMIPFVPIYSSFYQRAYDQIIHDVCLQNLHIVMCIDRAGIVGADGETHQGIYDLSFLRCVPNLTIMAPKDFKELEEMIEFAALNVKGPVTIRYPRGSEDGYKFKDNKKIKLGKAEKLSEGNDITIVAIGKTVAKVVKVAEQLQERNITSDVINCRFLKPIDTSLILHSIKKTGKVAIIEDNTCIGGLSSCIKELICENGLENVKVISFAYPDKFIEHGLPEELEDRYGLSVEKIVNSIVDR